MFGEYCHKCDEVCQYLMDRIRPKYIPYLNLAEIALLTSGVLHICICGNCGHTALSNQNDKIIKNLGVLF